MFSDPLFDPFVRKVVQNVTLLNARFGLFSALEVTLRIVLCTPSGKVVSEKCSKSTRKRVIFSRKVPLFRPFLTGFEKVVEVPLPAGRAADFLAGTPPGKWRVLTLSGTLKSGVIWPFARSERVKVHNTPVIPSRMLGF